MDLSQIGRLIIGVGIVLLLIGIVLLVMERLGVRELPGTLRFETQNISCVVPILASIILSVVGTLVLNLIIRWINRP